MDYRHDEWGVDVTVSGSQKGLMLPRASASNAISAKALAASKTSLLPRSYWRWEDMLETNAKGFFSVPPGDQYAVWPARIVKILIRKTA